MGAYLIIGVWKESSLIERYAYWALNLKFVGGNPASFIFVFCLACGIISMIVPNIPLTALFLSTTMTVGSSLGIMTGLTPSI